MNKSIVGGFFTVLIFLFSCESDFQPKPNGYHRINPLQKNNIALNLDCPYTFSYPDYLEVQKGKKEMCSINLFSPYYNATLHLTYKPINSDFEKILYDFRRLTYEHTSKADGIDEVPLEDLDNKVYSLFYELHGPSASSLQFLSTDSFNHILRGSLYFNNIPNVDSIRPVHNIYKKDILNIIETLEWKND